LPKNWTKTDKTCFWKKYDRKQFPRGPAHGLLCVRAVRAVRKMAQQPTARALFGWVKMTSTGRTETLAHFSPFSRSSLPFC
jgi:hypothetical protein